MRRIHPALPLGLVFILTLAARLLPGPRTIDDAFITFRYVRNVLAGVGPVYNPGEAVFGTTTPLYTLVLTGLGFLGGGDGADLPVIAWGLNAVMDGVTVLLLLLIGRELGRPLAGWAAALVWVVAPMAVTFSIGGMETSLAITLVTATFYMQLIGRHREAALCASLAVLSRPDTLIALGPWMIERLRVARTGGPRERIEPAEGVAFFLPIAAWSVFAAYTYGSVLPHSIAAKVSAYQLPPLAGLVRLIQNYATPTFEHLTLGAGPLATLGLLAIYAVLFGLGAMETVRRHPGAWVLFVYPWAYFAVFAAANPLLFRWYLAPPLPMYLLGIFLGISRLARDIRVSFLSPVAVALAVASSLRAWTLVPDHGPRRPAPEMAYIQLELLYEEAARFLLPTIQPGDVVAAGDIGALGYFTNARILDTIGLITPSAVEYYPIADDLYVINYAVPPRLIQDQSPEFVVLLEVYGRRGLLQEPWFPASYRLLSKLPTDIYGSDGLLLFERRTEGFP